MAEVLRLLKTVIVKVDGLAADMKDVKTDVGVLKTDVGVLKTDVREIRVNLNRVDAKVDLFTGRFEDVAGVVIKDTQRTLRFGGTRRRSRRQS
jgi:DNA anti-recombination protein RmuC